jgi:autoinducer 2-degrading protein
VITHVHVRVVPEGVDAFRQATRVNAEASRREPGCQVFDAFQDAEDPTRFLLVEIYADPAAAAAHKQTAHYATWRDTVAPLMAEPRSARKYAAAW